MGLACRAGAVGSLGRSPFFARGWQRETIGLHLIGPQARSGVHDDVEDKRVQQQVPSTV